MKFKNYFYFALVSIIMGLCSSCGGDDGTDGGEEPTPPPAPESTLYADVDFVLNCSEDLLLYVTPQVTYTDNDGTKKTITIDDSEWSENKETKFNVAFVDGSYDAKVMKWTKRVRYTNFPIDKEMTVKYIRKTNMPPYDKERINRFYHYPSVAMQFVKTEGNNKHSTGCAEIVHHSSYRINKTANCILTEIVDYLGLPYIDENSCYSCVILGADNDYISEIVEGYTDKQGIKINSDGTYSVKYEDKDYVAPKPYADIVYTLNISEEMLKYSVPQVTYTGNDGKPVTYTIDEKEFEVNEKLNKWGTHFHGDEDKTYSEGEENAKILRWRKHIHYDDFSTVDDEISVTYIPKDNAGDMRLSHAYHNLSTGLVLFDGKAMRTFRPTNKYEELSSNIINGEMKTIWNFSWLDSNGRPIYKTISIDSFIGNIGFSFIDSSGNHVEIKFVDCIFDTFKDYQGVHLERNGDFKWKEPNEE